MSQSIDQMLKVITATITCAILLAGPSTAQALQGRHKRPIPESSSKLTPAQARTIAMMNRMKALRKKSQTTAASASNDRLDNASIKPYSTVIDVTPGISSATGSRRHKTPSSKLRAKVIQDQNESRASKQAGLNTGALNHGNLPATAAKSENQETRIAPPGLGTIDRRKEQIPTARPAVPRPAVPTPGKLPPGTQTPNKPKAAGSG